jgi:hypothetical protein
MAAADLKLKIIFNNVLQGIQINEISTSIQECSTTEETLHFVDEYKNSDYQVFVVCRQSDVRLLEEHILIGSIDVIYILDNLAQNIRNNNRRITASNEADLQTFIKQNAANYIRGVALDALVVQTNGQITAYLDAAYRLLESVRKSNNRNH